MLYPKPTWKFLTKLFMMRKRYLEFFHYDWLHLHHEDFTGQYGKFCQVSKIFLGIRNKKYYLITSGLGLIKLVKTCCFFKDKEFINGGDFCRCVPPIHMIFIFAQTLIFVHICLMEILWIQDTVKTRLFSNMAFKDFRLVTNPNQYESQIWSSTRENKFRSRFLYIIRIF